MLTYYKACEVNCNIVPLKVIEVQSEFLIILNKFDREERILRVGVNYGCYPTWDQAHRYLSSLIEARLNNLRKELQQVITNQETLMNMIESPILAQVA